MLEKLNISVAVLIAGIAGIIVFYQLAILLYAVNNGSGHTGLDLFRAIPFFLALFVIALVLCIFARKYKTLCLASSLLAAASLGAGMLPLYLYATKSLMEYNRWVQAGMPEPKNLMLYAVAFVIILFALLIGISIIGMGFPLEKRES